MLSFLLLSLQITAFRKWWQRSVAAMLQVRVESLQEAHQIAFLHSEV